MHHVRPLTFFPFRPITYCRHSRIPYRAYHLTFRALRHTVYPFQPNLESRVLRI